MTRVEPIRGTRVKPDPVRALVRGDVEMPTDYLGVLYVPMDDGRAWRRRLAMEMKTAGLAVDLMR
jgi:hypothetical protein